MRGRNRILPWAVCLSMFTHVAVLAGISVRHASPLKDETLYKVQLLDAGGGGSGTKPPRAVKPTLASKPVFRPRTQIRKRRPLRKRLPKRREPAKTAPDLAQKRIEQAEPAELDKPAPPNPAGMGAIVENKPRQVAIGVSTNLHPGAGTEGEGRAANNADWRKDYKRRVYYRIRRARRYPYLARRVHMEGRVVVRFTVSSSGSLESVRVIGSCPYPLLNSDALVWIRRAAPFPPFPPGADRSSMTFTYGLTYDLRD